MPTKTPHKSGSPAPVVDLAAACVRFVTQRYRVPLDFTPDTLSLVDQYVRDARLELKEKPETLALVRAPLAPTSARSFASHTAACGEPRAKRAPGASS